MDYFAACFFVSRAIWTSTSSESMPEAMRFLEFALNYQPDLAP